MAAASRPPYLFPVSDGGTAVKQLHTFSPRGQQLPPGASLDPQVTLTHSPTQGSAAPSWDKLGPPSHPGTLLHLPFFLEPSAQGQVFTRVGENLKNK